MPIINPDILIDQYVQNQDTNKIGKPIKYKGQIKEKLMIMNTELNYQMENKNPGIQ